MERLFTKIANAVAHAAGKPETFIGCCVIIVVWAVSGPFFGFSDTWQLIINTSSIQSSMPSPELLDYATTKAAIVNFTRGLAQSVAADGIRVNAVAPGPVWTPLNPSDKEAEDVSQFGAKTPMKRPAQPEEIAPAYVFLASPHCSSYITGEILPIIGGY